MAHTVVPRDLFLIDFCGYQKVRAGLRERQQLSVRVRHREQLKRLLRAGAGDGGVTAGAPAARRRGGAAELEASWTWRR